MHRSWYSGEEAAVSQDLGASEQSGAKQGNLPPLAMLRALEATFTAGGVRRAAVQLGLHHTVVSRHLKHLEEWLGVSLYTRSGNRLMLNETGRRYHARISEALVMISRAGTEAKGSELENQISLWCLPVVSIEWLTRHLVEFRRHHADFSIEVKPSHSPPNLSLYEADADVRFYRDAEDAKPGGRNIKFVEIGRPSMVVVGSPGLVSSLPPIRSPQELASFPLLHGSAQDDWRNWLRSNGVVVPGKLPGPLCWHAHLAFAEAKLGRGLILISRFLVAESLREGSLVEMPVPGIKHHNIGAYTFAAREDRWSTPPIAALRKFLTKKMMDNAAIEASTAPNSDNAPSPPGL